VSLIFRRRSGGAILDAGLRPGSAPGALVSCGSAGRRVTTTEAWALVLLFHRRPLFVEGVCGTQAAEMIDARRHAAGPDGKTSPDVCTSCPGDARLVVREGARRVRKLVRGSRCASRSLGSSSCDRSRRARSVRAAASGWTNLVVHASVTTSDATRANRRGAISQGTTRRGGVRQRDRYAPRPARGPGSVRRPSCQTAPAATRSS
jgi:hypothetical protein